MSDKYYTLKEISCLIKTPILYLRKIVKEHKLKGHFIGRQYIVSEKELKDFINSVGVKNER
ncbi:MAG: hypothetical protein ACI4XM_00140 [Candidatus Coprovivens sp.]